MDLEHTLKADLIEGSCGQKYLPTSFLRDVDPALFTLLRGILKIVSYATDSFPIEGTGGRRTTTGATSKVGLERTQFRKLIIVDKDTIPQLRKYIPKILPVRKPNKKENYLPKGGEDMETVRRVF